MHAGLSFILFSPILGNTSGWSGFSSMDDGECVTKVAGGNLMNNQIKTIEVINERIKDGSVNVVTASEMTQLLQELGPVEAAREVDVVTTGTFGAMCSSGVWMNLDHADPPIKMSKLWLNDMKAFTRVAAVDGYLGAGQPLIANWTKDMCVH